MADLKEYITRGEKEGHLKTKTKFKKKKTPQEIQYGYWSQAAQIKKVTSEGEEAAVYDVEKNRKGNSYNAVNRHLINKLKG